MIKRRCSLPLLLALAAVPALPAGGAQADVLNAGPCSGASAWELNARQAKRGRIRIEWKVSSASSGRWKVRVRHNGRVIFRGKRSGSFTVKRRVKNRRGRDRFKASAKRGGETCRASVSY